jgi:hypothetical protein
MVSPEVGRLDPDHVTGVHVTGFAGDFSGVRRFAERDHRNLVQWNMHPEPGGHYAAHLEPDVLADDIRAFYAGRR